jgi:hypothetical protein
MGNSFAVSPLRHVSLAVKMPNQNIKNLPCKARNYCPDTFVGTAFLRALQTKKLYFHPMNRGVKTHAAKERKGVRKLDITLKEQLLLRAIFGSDTQYIVKRIYKGTRSMAEALTKIIAREASEYEI